MALVVFFVSPRSYAIKICLGIMIPKNILPSGNGWFKTRLEPLCMQLSTAFLVQRISLYTAKLTILFNYKELHFFTYGFIALHDSACAALMCVSFPKNTLLNIFYIICSKKSRVTSCKRQKSWLSWFINSQKKFWIEIASNSCKQKWRAKRYQLPTSARLSLAS